MGYLIGKKPPEGITAVGVLKRIEAGESFKDIGISIYWIQRWKKENAEFARRYDELFAELPVITPWEHPDSYSGLHLYIIRLQLGDINKTHRQVFEFLRDQGVGVNLHYIPVHTQPYYRNMGFNVGDFPRAESYYRDAISLPMFPTLQEEQQDYVVSTVRQALT